MASEDFIVKVFIASPGGLDNERELVKTVLEQIVQSLPVGSNITFRVLGWEQEVGEYGRPQEQLNPMVRVCHVFIGLLADRLGSPTGTHDSGFGEEYGEAVARREASEDGYPKIYLFVKQNVPLHDSPLEQLQAVRRFVDGVKEQREALVNHFDGLEDLEDKLRRAFTRLATELQQAKPPDSLALAGQPAEAIKPPEREAPQSEQSPEAETPEVRRGDDHPPPEDDDAGEEPEAGPGRGPRDTPPPAPPGDREEAEQPPGDWNEALIGGPLRESGQLDAEREAEQLADDDPAAAAALLRQVGESLLKHGWPSLADIYLDRAAALFERAGNEPSAADVLEGVTWRQLRRGSGLSGHNARRLLQLLPDDQRWRAAALTAMAEWPENVRWSIDALSSALGRLDVDDRRRLDYAAHLTGLLLMERDYEQVLALHARLGEIPLGTGAALDLELDRLDALEAAEGAERAEAGWQRVLSYADQLDEEGSGEAARTWQRRGVALTARGEVPEARAAFLRAVVQWQRRQGYEDQVREAYFASQVAAGLNGAFFAEGERLRPFVANLRGARPTPASRAGDLEDNAMSYRLRGKAFDALRNYGLAFDQHRRAGNLRGQNFVQELLGELHLNAKQPLEALAAFVQAGRESDATKAARSLGDDSILQVLDFGHARWRRSASLAAVAAVGRNLSSDAVSQLAEQVVTEAARDVTSLVTPQPAMRAQEALAAIAFGLPERWRAQGLQRLRQLALGAYVGTARPAAEALSLMTNAGVSDETRTLVEAFISDASISGLSPIWVGEQLHDHPDAAQAILDAALDGSVVALEAAAIAGLPAEHAALIELGNERVQAIIDAPTIEEREEEGRIVRSVGIGAAFELPALLARYSPPELRRAFAEKMASTSVRTDIPMPTRASAANALFNLAEKLDTHLRLDTAARLAPLLDGEIEPSPWDTEDPGVMARFRFSVGSQSELRAAALTAWSKLRADEPEAEGDGDLLEAALVDQEPAVARAAYDSYTIRTVLPLPAAAAAGLAHGEPAVRASAVACWINRTRALPSRSVLQGLLEDKHPAVRLTLLAAAQELAPQTRTELIQLLTGDVDAYVRARARQALEAGGS